MKPDNITTICLSVVTVAVVWGAVKSREIDTAAKVAIANATPTEPAATRCILDSAQIARLVTCYEGGCFTPVGAEQ